MPPGDRIACTAAKALSMAVRLVETPAKDAVHQHEVEVSFAEVVPQVRDIIDDVVRAPNWVRAGSQSMVQSSRPTKNSL